MVYPLLLFSWIILTHLLKIRSLCYSLIQVRSHVKSNMHFPHAEEVTCGGNALPFHAAIRLKMIRTGLIKTDDKVLLGTLFPLCYCKLDLP